MIFADKLIQLRKKAGWSQEELAEQLQVTRQSVSKWESAQSMPDLEKIIRLSELFSVSIDYLLKEEQETAADTKTSPRPAAIRQVTLAEATAFLALKRVTSKKVALATYLCILSPICLLLLLAISQTPGSALPELIALGIGIIVLLFFVAIAVAIFISCDSKTSSFAYLEKEVFTIDPSVKQMVTQEKAQTQGIRAKQNITGVCLCIASLLPICYGTFFNKQPNLLLLMSMISLMLVLIGIGVMLFIRSETLSSSYDKLLQVGEYTPAAKEKQNREETLTAAYWSIIVAIFLGYSFWSGNWGYSWIIWVVAGAAFPAVLWLFGRLDKNKD